MRRSELDLTAAQYATLLDAAEDVIFFLDREQRYMGIWGRWMDEYGLDGDMFLGKTSWEIFGEETRDEFESFNERVLAGELVEYGRWFDTPWGAHIYYQTALSPMRDDKGEIVGVVGVGRDITDMVQAGEQLEHMATHDPLTDLPNRYAFRHAVERASARSTRGALSTLLFLDVDEFKACNDDFGHAAGDEVLKAIASALRDRLREPDIVARIGGDEFGVVLEGSDVEIACKKATELRDAVRDIGIRFGHPLDLSIGVTPIVPEVPYDDLLSRADGAMYEAKVDADVHVVVAAAG